VWISALLDDAQLSWLPDSEVVDMDGRRIGMIRSQQQDAPVLQYSAQFEVMREGLSGPARFIGLTKRRESTYRTQASGGLSHDPWCACGAA
jgi:hypothetical protein